MSLDGSNHALTDTGARVLRMRVTPLDTSREPYIREIAIEELKIRKVTLPGLGEGALDPVRDVLAVPADDVAPASSVVENNSNGASPAPAAPAPAPSSSLWSSAVRAPAFINIQEHEPEWTVRDLLAPHGVMGIASPRGLGKTHVIHHMAVQLAVAGIFRGEVLKPQRILIADRDNPPTDTRRRLRRWGAKNADRLSIMTRDQLPLLTDRKSWSTFPFRDYDALVIDAFGSSTEGSDEKETPAMSRALASLLDIGRKGPAIIVLFNTTRDGKAIRGSGSIMDRLDALYEVRDATDLKLDSRHEVWWDALPPAGDKEWAANAKRRRMRTIYRLAFVPSKWRLGPQPDPWCVEISLPDDAPWSCRDVTAELETELTRIRGEAIAAHEEALTVAVEYLKEAIGKHHAKCAPLHKRGQAEKILMVANLTRDEARDLIDKHVGVHWLQTGSGRKGDPVILLPLDEPLNGIEGKN